MRQKKIIELSKDRSLVLKYNSLEDEDEIDIDRIVKIDFNNIPSELVTFPVILSQFAIHLAELEDKVNLAKFNLEVLEAELSIEFREAHKEETTKDLSNEKAKEKVLTSTKYKMKSALYFKALKDFKTMSGIYWSMRSKDEKLNKIANSTNIGDSIESILSSKLKKFNYVDLKIITTNL